MALSSNELETLADVLLDTELKDKKKNKARTTEYPVLSKSQLKRRESMEIPYSNLSNRQRMECRTKNLEYDGGEGDA